MKMTIVKILVVQTATICTNLLLHVQKIKNRLNAGKIVETKSCWQLDLITLFRFE